MVAICFSMPLAPKNYAGVHPERPSDQPLSWPIVIPIRSANIFHTTLRMEPFGLNIIPAYLILSVLNMTLS